MEESNQVYLPSLNGIRAICITLVVGSHAAHANGFPRNWAFLSEYIFNGQLGVTIFFVLSGFLITYLLAREESKSGKIDLGAFYIRRFIRIVPVYITFLFALWILTLISDLHISKCQWLTALTYTKNFGCGSWIDGHLWSLSVEEQFYFLWPFVFAFLSVPKRLGFAFILIFIAPFFRAWLYSINNTGLYLFSFMTNMDAIMIGSLMGIAYHRWADSVKNLLAWKPTFGRVIALLAIYFIWLLRVKLMFGIFTVTIGNTIQSIAAAYLISSYATIEKGYIYKILNLSLLKYLGVLSYSLYIWQQPFFSSPSTFGYNSHPLLIFPINLIAALTVAALSYHFLEMPLLGLRKRFRASSERDNKIRIFQA